MRKGRCSFEKFKVAVGGTYKWNHAGEKWRYDANGETSDPGQRKRSESQEHIGVTGRGKRRGRIGQGRHQC